MIKKFFAILILSLSVQLGFAQVIPAPKIHCAAPDTARNDILTWDAVGNQPCGAFIGYRIYRATAIGGPYTLVTVITNQNATTWSDLAAANTTYYYYIQDSFNCPGATYASSDTLRNEPNPATPGILGVNVLPDSTVQFTWSPSTSPQTTWYVIYLITPNGTPIIIDSVYGRFTTSWIDSVHNPYASALNYTIDARDSCAFTQPSAFNTSPQQSILAQYQTAHCDRSIGVTWSRYVNLPGGVRSYEVFVSKNAGPYEMVADIDTSTFNYDYPNFADGDSLQIYVVAVSALDTNHVLHSNYMRFTANVVKPPSYIYITNITVDATNNVDLTWLVDNKAKILSYEVQRSEDNAQYLLTKLIHVGPPLAVFSSFADSTVEPQYEPYYYTVTVFDSCNGSIVTPYAEHISLQGTLSDYYEISLNWNPLHIFNARVLKQNLYRDIGDGTGMHLVRTFNDSTHVSFVDSVYQYLDKAGNFCYRIEAVYHIVLPDAHYDTVLSSFSNIACVDHRPIIYIPNAFVYNGTNNFFKPRIIFGDPQGYTMTIFNRYGGKIFETHDPNEGWYGNDGGKPAQQGGYAYLIQFTASDGTAIERSGIVMMLRK
ncbi:MAG: gliding motility-associated C-terminal domain-containing protein [Bacteroidetes bacterium]|nr:gliding motility-associated C-terminal domain-containing protein [Bacteroidota bacterium]